MSTKTATHAYEDAFDNLRKVADANLKLQQEMMQQWTNLWPGVSTKQDIWPEQLRQMQKQWTQTMSDLVRQHRDAVDRQYEAALESLDDVSHLADAKDAAELRDKSQELCRKSFECFRELSEAQINSFQESMKKWGDLMTQKPAK